MKFTFGLIVLCTIVCSSLGNLSCEVPVLTNFGKNGLQWTDMDSPCISEMRRQIRAEVNASLLYLKMAAHFSRDTVNRPGFAKFFFEAAKEEREHAMHLIEYLTMRGELTATTKNLLEPNMNSQAVRNGEDALKIALEAEVTVTNSIRKVVKKCEENKNDYHLVDYLTGVYLEEQYKGQRDLAGKLVTLGKMMQSHGEIGEFLFDKTLL